MTGMKSPIASNKNYLLIQNRFFLMSSGATALGSEYDGREVDRRQLLVTCLPSFSRRHLLTQSGFSA
jgi:hypothetical protein